MTNGYGIYGTGRLASLLSDVEPIKRPPVGRGRDGRLTRASSGEWDPFQTARDDVQRWARRHLMAATGCTPDDLASMAGMEVSEWWTAVLDEVAGIIDDDRDNDDRDDDGRVHLDEIMGAAEVAEWLGVTESAVRKMRQRGQLPIADAIVSRNPVWTRRTIERWGIDSGRLIQVEEEAA